MTNVPLIMRDIRPMQEASAGLCCPVCTSREVVPLGFVVDVPILMNRLYDSRAAGRAAPRGPLALVSCRTCGFTWNSRFRDDLITYDEAYENDQSFSPLFRAHIEERAHDVVGAAADESLRYLEIGCGQGHFIEVVAGIAGSRLESAEGFDPAWRGADGTGPAASRIHKAYFGVATSHLLRRPPNVVVSRHTIEHVADPVGFLSSIREALGPQSTATMFIETPCIEWILRNGAMQDFFYEHCSLFTAPSLALALTKAGFADAKVRHVFGGQYLWAEAAAGGAAREAPLPDLVPAAGLEDTVQAFVTRWRATAETAAARGKLAIWGAGAKGVRFAMMVDPDGVIIDHVIDVNPRKQGKFLPGTGLPVLSPQQSAARAPTTIIVMNPNYLEESAAMALNAGLRADMVPLSR